MTKEQCIHKAAQVWCKPFCSNIEMDVDLAHGFADTLFEEVNKVKSENSKMMEIIKELASAIEWCSGSADFGYDGKARIGWENICIKALNRANHFMIRRGAK